MPVFEGRALLHDLARTRGEEYVENHRSMLLTSLRFLVREGRLLEVEEFERTQHERRKLTPT